MPLRAAEARTALREPEAEPIAAAAAWATKSATVGQGCGWSTRQRTKPQVMTNVEAPTTREAIVPLLAHLSGSVASPPCGRGNESGTLAAPAIPRQRAKSARIESTRGHDGRSAKRRARASQGERSI